MRQSRVALHCVFTMRTLNITLKGTVAICAIAFVLTASFAQAQEAQRLPTIADCPAGTVLAVQDTDQPQPWASIPHDPSEYTVANQDKFAAEDAARRDTAPHQFVTGCVPPQQQQ